MRTTIAFCRCAGTSKVCWTLTIMQARCWKLNQNRIGAVMVLLALLTSLFHQIGPSCRCCRTLHIAYIRFYVERHFFLNGLLLSSYRCRLPVSSIAGIGFLKSFHTIVRIVCVRPHAALREETQFILHPRLHPLSDQVNVTFAYPHLRPGTHRKLYCSSS